MKKLASILTKVTLCICLTYSAVSLLTTPVKAARTTCDCEYWSSEAGAQSLNSVCQGLGYTGVFLPTPDYCDSDHILFTCYDYRFDQFQSQC
jgi:hypothetical protein